MAYIIYPDYKGQASVGEGSFLSRLRATRPEDVIIPVLNGLEESSAQALSKKIENINVRPEIATGLGLLKALICGYKAALGYKRRAPIVRLDTAEHPVDKIGELLYQFGYFGPKMVIGDVGFDGRSFKQDSSDRITHLLVFPALYKTATRGKLCVSCAHGFQAFDSRESAELIFSGACRIVDRLESNLGKPVTWGFDGAMALSAIGQKLKTEVIKLENTTMRDRPDDKIRDQAFAAVQMLRAAAQTFPHVIRSEMCS